MGKIKYFLTSGIENGWYHDIEGNPTRLAPIGGTGPDIGFSKVGKLVTGLKNLPKILKGIRNSGPKIINWLKNGQWLRFKKEFSYSRQKDIWRFAWGGNPKSKQYQKWAAKMPNWVVKINTFLRSIGGGHFPKN